MIAGLTTCIITGDKDLLMLGKFETVDMPLPRGLAAYDDRLAAN